MMVRFAFLRLVLLSIALMTLSMTQAQLIEPPGEGGGAPQGVPIGGGWYIIEMQKRTVETVVTSSLINGQVQTTTRVRNNNDGLGGLWIVDGVPTNEQFPIPASGNISASWEVEGTYYFKLKYLGEGSPSSGFFTSLKGIAESHVNNFFLNSGTHDVDNGLDGFGNLNYDPVAGCNSGNSEISSELLILTANGNELVYETPVGHALATSTGPQASAFADLSFSFLPTDRSVSISSVYGQPMKAKSIGITDILLQFANSSYTMTVPGTHYIPEAVEPTIGLAAFQIAYQVGRPIDKAETVVTESGSFNSTPNVPYSFQIWHSASASPMGQLTNPDSFGFTGGSTYLCPPTFQIPSSPAKTFTDDYLRETTYTTALPFIIHVQDYFLSAEAFQEKFKCVWADGVKGQAIANVEVKHAHEVTETILPYFTVYHDLVGWSAVTPRMSHSDEFYEGPVIGFKKYIAVGAAVADLTVLATQNVYVGIAAALLGLGTELIEEFEDDVTPGVAAKIYPENWWNHVANANSNSDFGLYAGDFNWQVQAMPASNVKVDYFKVFGFTGFESMGKAYTYDPIEHRRTLYWHPGVLPDENWFEN